MPNLLRNGIIALVICTILVLITYFYLDKPLALLVYHRGIDHFRLLLWFSYLSAIFFGLITFYYLVFIIRFAYSKARRWDYVLLGAANSIVITTFIKIQLKFVFGRYWALPWLKKNPSLISNKAYGFNFFHGGAAYSSFPSGHGAIIVAAMSVFWFAYPRFRWLYTIIVLLVLGSLVGMDFHFLSDVIAGGFLGGLVGYYIVNISKLKANG